MRKLIAKRPIRYMGRDYERGEVVPAQDARMVEAWMRAGSAAWTDDNQTDAADVTKAIRETAKYNQINDATAGAIRAMGVATEDADGEFVGIASLEEQLRAIFGGNCEDGASADMMTGRLDENDLKKWKKEDLEKLAAEMGVDISRAKNNAERAAILAAEEVLAPVDDPGDDGGTQ